jgi:hypothetical protein
MASRNRDTLSTCQARHAHPSHNVHRRDHRPQLVSPPATVKHRFGLIALPTDQLANWSQAGRCRTSVPVKWLSLFVLQLSFHSLYLTAIKSALSLESR